MKYYKRKVKAVIYNGDDSGYVCTCPDFPVVTQGATLDEVINNFREAIALHFEGDTISGFTGEPDILFTIKPGTVTDDTRFYSDQ